MPRLIRVGALFGQRKLLNHEWQRSDFLPGWFQRISPGKLLSNGLQNPGLYHYLHRLATQVLTKRPTNEETELDPGLVCLQGWFDHQNTCRDLRSERGGTDLSTARMMVLDQAKFPWLLALKETWQKGFNELVKYKEEHRSTRVPRSHDLGNWVSNQRRIKKNNNMSKVRADKLKGIEFEWTLNKSWDERFAELVFFAVHMVTAVSAVAATLTTPNLQSG